MKNKLFAISIFLMLFAGFAEAQQNGGYKISKTIKEGEPILFKELSNGYALPKYPYQVRSAKMYFTLRATNPQKSFYEARFTPKGAIGNIPVPEEEMLVTNGKDAHTISVDVESVFANVDNIPQNIAMSDLFGIDNNKFKPLNDAALKNAINFVMEIALEIEYKIDVATQSITNQALEIDNKVAKFRWQSLDYAPNYQIQILRLYHTIQDKVPTSISIYTFVDWSTALTIETQTDKKEFSMTIGEGSGFYIWRVRPIGSFYENGNANPKNVGKWSFDIPEGKYAQGIAYNAWLLSVSLESSTTQISVDEHGTHNQPYTFKPYALFYYRDIDENINHIYTRVFTEKSGISEKIVYANTLGQAAQTQTYLESQKQTVTAQTIQSYTGAPVINTLPVPMNEDKLKGYKEKFVTPSNDDKRPYLAKDFDEGNKIKEPSEMVVNGSNYYLGANHVASAEGYMFSRALYTNDATGRVIEQSGVGKKHMIASNTNDKGKTTKMVYASANEYELLRMFGNEAPNASSVTKVITEDPNGTKSIQYTSKEGKVLATCLLKEPQNDLDALLPSDKNANIKDLITLNQSVSNKIVSAKSYYFPTESTLDLEYKRECAVLFGEPLDELKKILKLCEYELEIFVSLNEGNSFTHDIDAIDKAPNKEWSFVILDPNNLSNPINRKTLKSKKHLISCFSDANGYTIPFNTLHKLIGNFTVEKQLTPKGANADELRKLMEEREGEILPLADMLTEWMRKIKCSKDEAIFYNKILFLEAALKGNLKWPTTPEIYNDTEHEQQIFENPPLLLPSEIPPSVEYGKLNKFFQKELGFDTEKVFFKAGLKGSFHKLKFYKYLKVEITIDGDFCNIVTIPLSLSLAFDLSKITLVDVGSDTYYKINPFVHLDRVLESNGNSNAIKTEFYPDLEGYSYGYLWDAVPSSFATLNASIENLLSSTNELYPYIKEDLALGVGETAKTALGKFKSKYANVMHFADATLLDKNFIGESDVNAGEMTVKEFLGLPVKKTGDATPIVIDTDNDPVYVANLKLFYIHYQLLRKYMNGWHTPGTFSLMVNKMLTDVYSTDGFTTDGVNDEDRALLYEGPLPKNNDCGEGNLIRVGEMSGTTMQGTVVTIPGPNDLQKRFYPQYRIDNLLKCWESQLGIVRQAAIEGKPAEGNKPSDDNIKAFLQNLNGLLGSSLGQHDSFQDDNGAELNNELRGRIRLRGIARLFAGKKVRQMLRDPAQYFRMTQMPPSERAGYLLGLGYSQAEIDHMGSELLDLPFIKPMYQYHMVSEFLQCTGYKFAKITMPGDRQPLNGSGETSDAYINIPGIDTHYNNFRTSNSTPSTWEAYDGKAKNRKYYPNKKWNQLFEDKITADLASTNFKNPFRLFDNIFDPVYAFKYFDYQRLAIVNGTRQETSSFDANYDNPYRYLEITSCFHNYKPQNEECYVCGIGKIGCVQTRVSWSAGQRYAFYQMLRAAFEDKNYDGGTEIRAEEMLSTAYYDPYQGEIADQIQQQNPTQNLNENAKTFRSWKDEASGKDGYLKTPPPIVYTGPDTTLTLVQMELQLLNKDVKVICEKRKDVLRQQVINVLHARCYEIVDCLEPLAEIPTPTSEERTKHERKILTKDIDQIVEVLIAECKARGKVTSFRVYNAPCNRPFNFAYNKDPYMPIVEYGTGNGQVGGSKAVMLKRNKLTGNFLYSAMYNILNLGDWFKKSENGIENEELKIWYDGNLISIYDNTSYIVGTNGVKCLNDASNTATLSNVEWLRREQALAYKMTFDMPCKCVGEEDCGEAVLSCSPPPPSPNNIGYHAVYQNGNFSSTSTAFETSPPNHNPRRLFLPSRWYYKPQKPKQSDIKTIKIVQTN